MKREEVSDVEDGEKDREERKTGEKKEEQLTCY